MKKHITWNSVENWGTKIVKNHGFVHRQPSAYRAKPGSKCYVIDRFIGTIAECSEYCALINGDAVEVAACRQGQYREFASINHR